MKFAFDSSHWALVLGGSSGFGLATVKRLAQDGMNIAVVHRDRKGAMAAIEREFEPIRKLGVGFVAYNIDALSPDGRKSVLDDLKERMGSAGRVRVLLHSIAFGNLKLLIGTRSPYGAARKETLHLLANELSISEERLESAMNAAFEQGADALHAVASPPNYDSDLLLDDEDFARTIHSMGTSLASWSQDVLARGFFAPSARVVGLTSEGNAVAWRGYAAVAAAKVALESVARAMALEFSPYGVRTFAATISYPRSFK